ncbi:MAG: mannose-1-phosphate guanylyltransferase [Fibrobacteres bacterium]|nr:mannose-1-phosphate guanylyltransferase [Fibrobacterota bacterium]
MKNLWSVIMAGGIGERFWPLSTQKEPKQFLPVFTGTPLLKAAADRMGNVIPSSRAVVVTNAAYAKKSADLFSKTMRPFIIGEPVGKNTAPAIAAAAAYIERKDSTAVMAVFSADHIIQPESKFRDSVKLAAEDAEKNGSLVCLGVKPNFPHTGLGYIETAGVAASSKGIKLHKVRRFVEKPDLKKAQVFLKKGNYFWNCGIFVWSVKTIFAAFEKNMPKLYEQISEARKAKTDAAFSKAINKFYLAVEKESIDYGVLEKASGIKVVECPIKWDDMGSYAAFKEHSSADKAGNVFKGDIVDLECSNTFVYSDGGLTVTAGLKDLFVVRSGNKVLVIQKDKLSDMRKIINLIKEKGFDKFLKE